MDDQYITPAKACTQCSETKPLDQFALWNRGRDGHRAYCKACGSATERARRQSDPDHMRAIDKARYYRDRESLLARNAVYRANNPDIIKAAYRRWLDSHRESYNIYQSAYSKARPGLKRARGHARRARIRGNGGKYTASQWQELVAMYDHRCLRCGVQGRMTVDHVVSIAEGGTNTIQNIQPLCLSCNQRKWTRTVDYRLTAFAAILRRRAVQGG